GFEPDAVVGADVFAFAHPDDVPKARKLFERALSRPGEDVPGTVRMLAADGRTRLFEMNVVNRLDDPSVQAVVVNYRDVTDRDATARELAQQHALLEGLFASVPDILCYKDRDDRFLGGNPAFEAFAGRPMADLVGKSCREVFSGEWVERLVEAERAVMATGRPERGKEWLAYPDGRKVLLDIILAPLRDDSGAVIGVIVLGRDVTEQHRLEEELRQSHKMEAVGRLAGGIAHDFNNLLTVVLGNIELVRCGSAAGADADEMLAGAERAARQAAELTKQMLGFARRQALRTTAVDLNELVRESLGLLRRAVDPRIEVAFRPDPHLRPVAADPVQLQQ
ncbi:MAG: PAS domain-containing protein, partial [Gemmataceae bacterium]|nr:PAS domain-containing protein [Gemmataceae bacterium]